MNRSKSLLAGLLLLPALLLGTARGYSQEPASYDRLITAVSWYQNSAEMVALYHQGFNIARERMDAVLAKGPGEKPYAVVVDIDETMLDNSPYETTLITSGDSRDGWTGWTAKASALALPGALEFALDAQKKGVEIFYITNRDDLEREATLANLLSTGFPYATEDHLLTRSDTAYSTGNTSSKVGRRLKVEATHQIILLIGDNLNDFAGVFEDRSINYGKDAVEANKEKFGYLFIVLPNPMYGAWEKPILDYQHNLSEKEKTAKMREKLR